MRSLLFACLVAAGGGAPAAPPRGAVELRLTVYSSSAEVVIGEELAAKDAVKVEAVWLSLKDLAFRDLASCRATPRAQIKGPVMAELVSGKVAGLPEHVVAPAWSCGLDLTLRRTKPGAEGLPSELRGRSLLVLLRRGDGVPVIVRSRLDRTIALEAVEAEGFAPADGTPRLFLAVDAARWLRGLDLDGAESSGSGAGEVVRIDEKSNRDLLEAFEANVPAGLAVFRDEDGDGALGEREREDARRLAAPRPRR
jgi:hypothetical protein